MEISLTCNTEVDSITVPVVWLTKVQAALSAVAAGAPSGTVYELLAAEARFLHEEAQQDVATCPFDGDAEVLPTQRRDIGVAECPLCGTEHEVDKADFDPRH